MFFPILRAQTPESLVRVAGQRLFDARALSRAGGRTTATVYLSGYVVETLIKAAYFTVAPLPGGAVFATNQNVENECKRPNLLPEFGFCLASFTHAVPVSHDLFGWFQMLAMKRSNSGLPYLANLSKHANIVVALTNVWEPGLRYDDRRVSRLDADAVLSDVAWFYDHRTDLWT